MKTIAYIRVSTDQQDLDRQRLSIYDYADKHNLKIDDFIQIQVSSRKSVEHRKINELLEILESGDRLIVSELSRLARSLGQIVRIVDELNQRKIKLTAIKENIHIDEKQDMQAKIIITMFALFADIERDLISLRTKKAMDVIRAQGKRVGRPKGSLGKSKLDGREKEIQMLLSKNVSKAAIGRITGASRTTVRSFIKSRNIKKGTSMQ